MPTLKVDFEIKGSVDIPTPYNATEEEKERLIKLAYENVEKEILLDAEFDEDSVWINDSEWK
ncbi:hypothetical protein BL313_03240 [Staphylococcus hominis]|uniref:hypothetical protein n=1 Tax=Staphylococcus hominis TaxID=1290 RepID=UPI0008A8ED0C|nr:hypothetical protein [Staphylococcus hominis]OHO58444.1 hypothetical protein HMPREF2650_05560 [Staphylococcus sp. HMSC035F02]OJH01706.1 hypothetical protein BL313_03240 [Staphylococcus hominis]